ncbi:hypothetical protein [Streptomyces sp. 8N616]|uniref:hypothetical protein n=1 Tax=Streptomyces sp. 8N616 TaxID=3457414 RepID=UPI003FD4DA92
MAAALDLVLRAPEGPHALGTALPVEVELRNVGDKEVWVVGVLDGSEEGVRFPHYRPTITRGGIVVQPRLQKEDPHVGPLRPEDFRRLAPGEGFDPTVPAGGSHYLPLATFASFRPTQPGRYRYGLTLATGSESPQQWLGGFGQRESERETLLDLVGRVPRGTVTARPVEIEFA